MGLEIYLRDINQSIVEAWFNEFLECGDVHISKGDIFDIGTDAIISPGNCAKQMKHAYDSIINKTVPFPSDLGIAKISHMIFTNTFIRQKS